MSKSKKLKQPSINTKISSEYSQSIGCKSKCPSISFEYLTKNKDYNFEFFGKGKQQCKNTKIAVLDRIQEITCKQWRDLLNMPKEIGAETLDSAVLNFSPNEYTFSPEEKVYVFRFKAINSKKDYRIIGVKENGCSTYNIIGFDFNYSAYNHGA